MTIKKFKTIYFIYNADGGLLNEIKYWINKNLLKKRTKCELCDISHDKIFVRSEIPGRFLEKNYAFPCVIGETEDDLTEIINSISFSCFTKTEGVKELREMLFEKVV